MSIGDWGGGDSFRQVSSQGWFSRIGKAIIAVPIGLVLFLVSFVVLFWNEGRAVKTARSLAEGAAAVVSIPSDKVDAANEGKLVHVSGQATTNETLEDPDFHVSARAIHLQRQVSMYQWQEKKQTHTRRRIGGGTETVTEYSYAKSWADHPIDSGHFQQPGGHSNPQSWPFQTRTSTAARVTVGSFTLPADLVGQIRAYEPLAVNETQLAALSGDLKERMRLQDGRLYRGDDPASPEVGDMKVEFRRVPPTDVSLLAQQQGESFRPYQTHAGDTISRIQTGTASASEMFRAAEAQNAMMTWVLRLVGFVVMAVGIGMVLGPLSVLADVVPFFGSIVRFGTGLFAVGTALVFSLVTVAIGWMAYRPLVGGLVLLLAGGVLFMLFSRARSRPAGAIDTRFS